MKRHLESLLQIALKQLQESGEMPAIPAHIQVEATKDKAHGDYAANIAMILAKLVKKDPREVAKRIIQTLQPSPYVQKVEVAGPGFINFFLTPQALNDVVASVLAEKECYGRCKMGRGKRILVEFLSSTPIGPLHVNHGRHAAFGAAMSNLLDAVGFKSYREYYINDAGRQMDMLAVSVWLHYLKLCGEEIQLPSPVYLGEHIDGIARAIHALHGQHFQVDAAHIVADLEVSEDQDIYITNIVERAKQLLGDKYEAIFCLSAENILADIREDLAEFGIHFDNWFSERQFIATGAADKAVEKLREHGHIYEKDGALWFRATNFDDVKDRMLINADGQNTYFLNDLTYHINKFERGFDIAIDIFGANHHGYIPGMKAAMEGAGINPERLIHLLVQFVTLHSKNNPEMTSARHGKLMTLRKLRAEVGNDAARFFYVMRKSEQSIDFDLDLAKVHGNENPVYYVQYAYARICRIFKQLTERYDEANGLAHIQLLLTSQERQILNTLSRYPDIIVNAALHYEPNLVVNFLRELAADFHAYYNAHQFLLEDKDLRDARLTLIAAVRQTLLNGFNLLGISAPESM